MKKMMMAVLFLMVACSEPYVPGSGAIKDEVTGNYLCGHVAKKVDPNDPLVTEEICGESVMLRMSVMKKFLKANEAMKVKTGKCIKVIKGFLTNDQQKKIRDKLAEKSFVPKPCYTFHEAALAVDVENWVEAEKFLCVQGFVGGTKGVYMDPWHFSVGEMRPNKMAARAKQKLWWYMCKNPKIPDALKIGC